MEQLGQPLGEVQGTGGDAHLAGRVDITEKQHAVGFRLDALQVAELLPTQLRFGFRGKGHGVRLLRLPVGMAGVLFRFPGYSGYRCPSRCGHNSAR